MTAPPAENTRVAVWDRFPLTVVAPDLTAHRNCRVVLTRPTPEAPAYCWIWTDIRPTPELVWSGPWQPDETTPHARAPWALTTAEGHWNVERGRGCGCGSPLKAASLVQLIGSPRRGQL